MKLEIDDFFQGVRFDPKEHRYFVGNEELESISAILHRHTPPFDEEGVSRKIAMRDGLSPEEVKIRWEIRRDLATVRGTEFHFYAQTYLNEGRKIPLQCPIQAEVEQFHRFWDIMLQKDYEAVKTEWIVYDKETKVAGTIDLLIHHKTSGRHYLLDWKTNRVIRQHNPYETLLPPFEHLSQCELNKYSLQLNFYRYILEKNTPIVPEGLYIVHLCHENPKFRVISSKNFQKEIQDWASQKDSI